MTVSITHATVATGTDAGTGEIHKAEWNAGHTITGLETIAAAGGLVLLEEHEASSSASLDFTAFISPMYDDYMIEVVDLAPESNGVQIYIEIGTGAGPTYDTGSNYDWGRSGITSAGGAANDSGSAGTPRLFQNISNNAGYGAGNATLRVMNLQSTAHRKTFIGTIQYVSSDPLNVFATWGMTWNTTGTAVTALRFVASSGNLASGTVRIYGVAKTASSGTVAERLLAVYASQADATVNPDPVTMTQVPGMSVTFNLSVATDIEIRFALEASTSGGSSRYAVYVDGSSAWPEASVGGGFDPPGDREGSNNLVVPAASVVSLALAAGSHTVAIYESAVGSTASKTYKSRYLSVWDISATPRSVSVSGGILVAMSYTPGAAITQVSASIADIDATNVLITFTAPASGKVLVTLSCEVIASGGVTLGLRESTTTIAGLDHVFYTPTSSSLVHVSKPFLITGLTPGSSHTYKGAYGSDGFNANGINNKPIYLIVEAVP